RYSAHYYFSNADRRYNDNVRDRVRHRAGIGVQHYIDIDIGEYCDVECIAEYCCVVVGWRDRFLVPDININHNLGQWTCPHVPSYLPVFSSKGMAKFLFFELGLNKRWLLRASSFLY